MYVLESVPIYYLCIVFIVIFCVLTARLWIAVSYSPLLALLVTKPLTDKCVMQSDYQNDRDAFGSAD